jgi:ribosomal protein L29
MTNITDIRKQTDAELIETVTAARKTIQEEQFKDTFSRKAGIIRAAKKTVARAQTELSARRRNNKTN